MLKKFSKKRWRIIIKVVDEKICAICKRIIEPKDNYCRLTDYKAGEFFMESYYHTTCYNNQIQGVNPEQKKMKKAALSMLANAQKMMRKLQGEPEEVYELT